METKMKDRWRFRVGRVRVWIRKNERAFSVLIVSQDDRGREHSVRLEFKCLEELVFFYTQISEVCEEAYKSLNPSEMDVFIRALVEQEKEITACDGK
jgi:hypothetical protein